MKKSHKNGKIPVLLLFMQSEHGCGEPQQYEKSIQVRKSNTQINVSSEKQHRAHGLTGEKYDPNVELIIQLKETCQYFSSW